jgi:GDP-4-dehydro-6-deoxy-D-mannose reductase
MTTYLVTGAQGFTGRFTVAALLQADPQAQVVGSGRSTAVARTFTHSVSWGAGRVAAPLPDEVAGFDPARYRYLACDLADASAAARLAAATRPDIVIHLAAALRDDPAERLIASNVRGTIALLTALGTLERKPTVILGSSGSVYGAQAAVPAREDACCSPSEQYAMSKLAAEYAARVLAPALELPLLIARIFNIAGPGQDERHVCGRFAAQAAAIVAGVHEPRFEVGDLRPTRDFVDVRDVAEGLAVLAAHGAAGETYNIASGRESAIGEVLRLTLSLAGIADRTGVVERYTRSGDISRQRADITKLTALGYRPRYALEATLADLIAYYSGPVARAAG